MPHATKEAVVNGESSSKTLSHLSSYPAVSEGIETFKSNPYGKKSLELVDNAYTRFGKPVEQYLETPYQYAKPYVNKADEFGDRALEQVEGHFPIVKEKTGTIVEKAKTTVFWPYSYITDAWNDEYTKTASHNDRGAGISTSVLAVISLELRVASDFFHYVAETLRPAYEEGKTKADEVKNYGLDKADEMKKYGQDKYDQLKHETSKTGEQAKENAQKTKEKAQK